MKLIQRRGERHITPHSRCGSQAILGPPEGIDREMDSGGHIQPAKWHSHPAYRP